MPVASALIHSFEPTAPPLFDSEGEQYVGSYYQFIDEHDQPCSDMIGPYRDHGAAAKAAKKAFNRKDFG